MISLTQCFCLQDPLSFIPPPPPLWSSSGGSAGVDDTSNLLMLWYMCGFHTGSYMVSIMSWPLNPHYHTNATGLFRLGCS